MRDPPNKFLHELGTKYANKNMSSKFLSNLLSNRLVKIPDVYEVTMTF